MSLFDTLPASHLTLPDWRPEAPPSLSGIDEIELDFESNGYRWWAGDLPIGVAIATPDGKTRYLPWGHRGGGNIDEAQVAEFFKREIRGKLITNLNSRFEVHMAREWGKKWGVDLEAQGNTFSDVGHQSALLDDYRLHFSLASLVDDFLPGEQKVKVVNGITLNESDMGSHHASLVAVRAEADVRQVQKLKHLFRPKLEAEGLLEVKKLEDRLIWVTAEMEKNGARIDVDLLDRWLVVLRRMIKEGLQEIAHEVGRRTQSELFEDADRRTRPFNPDSPKDMTLLFERLNLPLSYTKDGRPSFTAAIMKAAQHPTIQKVFRLGKLIDVESRLARYEKCVDRSTGIIRYALHQLRAQKDEHDDFSSAGTVSGRYSSTKIDNENDDGLNIQQVWKPEQQRKAFGFDPEDDSHDEELFIIREIHIPEYGKKHLCADAMQIEYRLFANETNSARLLKIYEENPMASFHKAVHKMILPFKPDLSYRRQKDLNFAKIYGAGLRKMALMLEFISAEEYEHLLNADDWYLHAKIQEVKKINDIYNREIPEVEPLLAKAQHLAMNECSDYTCKPKNTKKARMARWLHENFPHRGFIKSLLGRRSRFRRNQQCHKALNTRIQPSAADIMKLKLIELHEARHDTGFLLRYPVHDEVDGDVEGIESARKVQSILNRQSVSLKVPILWEVGIGANWKAAGKNNIDEVAA